MLGLLGCAKGGEIVEEELDAGAKRDSSTILDAGGGNDASQPQPEASIDAGSCKTAPPSNVCGLDPQCGCGANATCDVDFMKLDGTTSCVPSTGGGMQKSKCAKTADCAPGLTCVFGHCRPYCSQDGATCAQPGTNKCQQLTTQNGPVPNLLVCYLSCALDDINSCGGAGMGCVYGGTNDVTDCRDLSAFGTTTCTQNNPNCAPGYVCLSNNQCARWCKVGVTVCGGGKQCISLNPMVKMGNQEFGVCN